MDQSSLLIIIRLSEAFPLKCNRVIYVFIYCFSMTIAQRPFMHYIKFISFFFLLIFADLKMRGLSVLFSAIFLVNTTLAQCPWQREVPDLQTSCLCAYNLGQELSVQCDQVRLKWL